MVSSSIFINYSCFLTEGISDKEIHHFKVNLKETDSSSRMTKLHSATKNGAQFRHTIPSKFFSLLLKTLLLPLV